MGVVFNNKSNRGSYWVLAFIFVALMGTACLQKSKDDSLKTVHLPVQAKIKGLDPALADDQYSGDEVGLVYEGLLQYHYLKRPYELIPNLAAARPVISKDSKTYTFTLKKGVLFQDDPCFTQTAGKGREMTVDDVVYSFKRLADPKLASPGWWVFDGKIVGLNAWHDAASTSATTDYTKPVEGLKAIDRYTLQIQLVQPSAQFQFALAMSYTSVVAKEAVELYGKEFINHPVGTGPFRIAEYNPNSRLVWVKNPTYRKELYPAEGAPGDKENGLLQDAGREIPLADKIIRQVFEESQPMWLTFLSGKLEVTLIPKDNYQQAITPSKELSPEFKQKGIRLNRHPDLDLTHTSFNMLDPLLGKNKLLRQALSYAYDSEKFIEIFYNGRALTAQGPIPFGIVGYDPTFKNPYRQFNQAKAKDLLAKAGYPEGKGLPPLAYAGLSTSTDRQIAEFATQMFAAIGVKLKVDTYSWPEFQAVVKNKKGQIWAFAWSADYPDAENFLQLFYSKNISPGPNDSNYINPEYDRLYEKVLTMFDSPERTAVYQQMVRIVVEDCPMIFEAHRIGYSLSQPWLKNFKFSDFEHSAAKYYRVEK